VLVEHPRIPVEAAVHTGLPVTLVRQHVVLETRGTLLLGSHTARALVVDMAPVSVGEMTL